MVAAGKDYIEVELERKGSGHPRKCRWSWSIHCGHL